MIVSRDIKHIVCVDRIKQLEKENKNLKLIQETNEKQIQNDIKERDEFREENKKLKIQLAEAQWEAIWLRTVVERLHEEIETLESELQIKNELNEELRKKIDWRKMSCEEKNENWYSLAIENAELKRQNDNLHEKLWRMQWAFQKFQQEYEEIERELEQIIMIR